MSVSRLPLTMNSFEASQRGRCAWGLARSRAPGGLVQPGAFPPSLAASLAFGAPLRGLTGLQPIRPTRLFGCALLAVNAPAFLGRPLAPLGVVRLAARSV